jgi:O-methyltransferase involved in polyketide biosynthesis
MAPKHAITLGRVQETLLVRLYACAVNSRERRPLVKDHKAVEMVGAIEWDFERFPQRWRVTGCVLRTARDVVTGPSGP